jgi:hypothetical protein
MKTIKVYAKAAVAAIGFAVTLGIALGLQNERWVAIIIAVASVLGVVRVKNAPPKT